MARYTGPKLKLSRRFGQALFGTAKEAKVLQRRNYPPGQHGPAASGRQSEYALQLREKQKAKIMYGLLERQFRKYFSEAYKSSGDTGVQLLQLLERRLDNVVYRLGLASTRAQARQLVNHGHVVVNGRRVDVPSYRVKVNDVIGVKPQSSTLTHFTTLAKSLENYQPLTWLELNKTALSGRVTGLPEGSQLEQTISPQLIVEFYSR
ncbi:MAG: 30S ribosomal protein S4 [Candidatus Kerfeldbacteria bacterium]|nr:30S ribosomal protein S4 [Candidatus Kerfeldbacteria bacterium]